MPKPTFTVTLDQNDYNILLQVLSSFNKTDCPDLVNRCVDNPEDEAQLNLEDFDSESWMWYKLNHIKRILVGAKPNAV